MSPEPKNLLLFVTAFLFVVVNLVIPIYSAERTLVIFLGIFIMILSVLRDIWKGKTHRFLVLEIFMISIVIRFVPAILLELPWEYDLGHAYAAEYISENAHVPTYYPSWQQLPYAYWPGSHVLLAIFHTVAGINTDWAYKVVTPVIGSLAVLFFYLFVKEMTLNNRLAIISFLLVGLFRHFIEFSTHVIAETLSTLMIFIALYSCSRIIRKETSKRLRLYLALAFFSFFVVNISHNQATYMFFVSLFAIIFPTNFAKSVNNKFSGFFLSCFVLSATWWTYVASTFFRSRLIAALAEVYEILRYGISSPWTLKALFSAGLQSAFFNEHFELLARSSSLLFYVWGGLGMVYVWRRKGHRFKSLVSWGILVSMSFAICSFTQLGNILMANRQLVFLAYPFSIFAGALILALDVYFSRLSKKCIEVVRKLPYVLLLFLVFAQCITAFPLYVYNANPAESSNGPHIYTGSDKNFGCWVKGFTSNDDIFLADTRMSNVLVYWGHREGTWVGEEIDNAFGSTNASNARNDILTPYFLRNAFYGGRNVYLQFIVVDVYNTRYKMYARWGMEDVVSNDALLLALGQETFLDRIYDNSKNQMYVIRR